MIFGVNMIKKKGWNCDSNTWDDRFHPIQWKWWWIRHPNTWDGKFHPIRGKKWWNGDPNTWDGRFYIPEKTKKEIERKIKNILG